MQVFNDSVGYRFKRNKVATQGADRNGNEKQTSTFQPLQPDGFVLDVSDDNLVRSDRRQGTLRREKLL